MIKAMQSLSRGSPYDRPFAAIKVLRSWLRKTKPTTWAGRAWQAEGKEANNRRSESSIAWSKTAGSAYRAREGLLLLASEGPLKLEGDSSLHSHKRQAVCDRMASDPGDGGMGWKGGSGGALKVVPMG